MTNDARNAAADERIRAVARARPVGLEVFPPPLGDGFARDSVHRSECGAAVTRLLGYLCELQEKRHRHRRLRGVGENVEGLHGGVLEPGGEEPSLVLKFQERVSVADGVVTHPERERIAGRVEIQIPPDRRPLEHHVEIRDQPQHFVTGGEDERGRAEGVLVDDVLVGGCERRRPPKLRLEGGAHDEAPVVLLERLPELEGEPESNEARGELIHARLERSVTEGAGFDGCYVGR